MTGMNPAASEGQQGFYYLFVHIIQKPVAFFVKKDYT